MTRYPPENTDIDRGDSRDQYRYSVVDINVISNTSIVKPRSIGIQWWISTSYPIPQYSTIVLLYGLCFLLIIVAITFKIRQY